MRYGSDNKFLEFLRHGGRQNALIALLVVGVVFILFGTLSGTESREMSAEEELSQMCSSIVGVGECRVMISYEDDRVSAVAVICEGGDEPQVKMSVCQLISSLYGIGYNRITVHKISEEVEVSK